MEVKILPIKSRESLQAQRSTKTASAITSDFESRVVLWSEKNSSSPRATENFC